MKIIDKSISLQELKTMASNMFGNFVKAVVDVNRGIMAVDAELHADEEAFLIANGSKQSDLWGINLYPELDGSDFVEFSSMINIKPSQDNRTTSVDNLEIRQKIADIASRIVQR